MSFKHKEKTIAIEPLSTSAIRASQIKLWENIKQKEAEYKANKQKGKAIQKPTTETDFPCLFAGPTLQEY